MSRAVDSSRGNSFDDSFPAYTTLREGGLVVDYLRNAATAWDGRRACSAIGKVFLQLVSDPFRNRRYVAVGAKIIDFVDERSCHPRIDAHSGTDQT